MPITIDSRTFTDEWNPATQSFISNVGDETDVIIDFSYSMLFDAGQTPFNLYAILVPDAPYSSTYVVGFGLNWDIENGNIDEFINKEITVLGFTGGGTGYNTTFNVSSIGQDIRGVVTSGVYGTDYDHILVTDTVSFASDVHKSTAKLYVSTLIKSIEFPFNINTENGSPQNGGALSDGREQAFITTNTQILDYTNLTPVALSFKNAGSYQTGSATIEGLNSAVLGTQNFRIKHTFVNTPISKGNILALSDVSNSKTLAYRCLIKPKSSHFDTNFYEWISLSTDWEANPQVGNTGAFDENFNSGDTNYSHQIVSIKRASDSLSVDGPIINTKFNVTFDIVNAADTPFSSGNTKLKVGIENKPSNVFSTTQDYAQKFINDSSITTIGAAATVGTATGNAASITNYTCVFVNTGRVTVSFDVQFTSGAIAQLGSGSSYFSIYCSVQNHLLNSTNSDRVALEIFDGLGVESILPTPSTLDFTKFLKGESTDIADAVNNTDIDGFPTQLLVGATRFSVDWGGRDDLRLDKVIQKLTLSNSVTGDVIDLDSTVINLAAFNLIDNKYPSVNYDYTKGFKIPTTEVRNRVRMYNDGDTGDVHYYQLLFPFFIRWEYYTELILTSIPSTIIDTTKTFDGKNYFIDRIESLANWSLNYNIEIQSHEGEQTFVDSYDSALTTTDYDQHPTVTDRSLEVFREDKTTSLDIGGLHLIHNEEKTFCVVGFENAVAPLLITDFDIDVFMEVFEQGSPSQIHRISSINGLSADSYFDDSGAGDGLIEKTIDGLFAQGKFYIDYSRFPVNAYNYRLYGQFKNPSENYIIQTFTFQTNFEVTADGTFSPYMSSTGGETPTWTLKDGYSDTTLTFIKADRASLSSDELNGVTQDVDVTFSTNNPANITEINFKPQKIVGVLDLSLFTKCITFDIGNTGTNNNTYTSFILPTLTTDLNLFAANLVSTFDTADLTPFGAYFGGTLQLVFNSGLTSVIFPITNRLFSVFDIRINNIAGVFDMRNIRNLSGRVLIATTLITDIQFHTSSGLINYLDLSGNKFVNLDLSSLTITATRLLLKNNLMVSCVFPNGVKFGTGTAATLGLDISVNNLTSLDFSSLTIDNSNSNLFINDNDLSVTSVDDVLSDLNAKTWTTCVLKLENQLPSPPSAAGDLDVIDLVTKGWTVTHD